MMGSVYKTPTRVILSVERGDRGARLCSAHTLALCTHDPVSTTLPPTSSRAFQGHTDDRTVTPAAMPDSMSSPDRTHVNPGLTPSEAESHTARPEAEYTTPAGIKYSIVCLPSVKTASTLPRPGGLTCTILRDPDDKSEEAKHYAVPMISSDRKCAAVHTGGMGNVDIRAMRRMYASILLTRQAELPKFEIFPYTPTTLNEDPSFESVHDAVSGWAAVALEQARTSLKTRQGWATLFGDLATAYEGLSSVNDERATSVKGLAKGLWKTYLSQYKQVMRESGLSEPRSENYRCPLVSTDLYKIHAPYRRSMNPARMDLAPLQTAVQTADNVIRLTEEEWKTDLTIETIASDMQIEASEPDKVVPPTLKASEAFVHVVAEKLKRYENQALEEQR